MHLTRFFKWAWLFQLLVGVALFGVSFFIENQILQAFFAGPALALVLTLALEVGKAASIVWHRYLTENAGGGYPRDTRIVSGSFRFALVLLSLICSLLYLGVQLDRPHLAAVRKAELGAIDAELKEAIARLETNRAARLAADQTRRNREYADARRDHQGHVEELESLLRAEMDNVVNGVFRGPRDQTIEQRLAVARAERDTALTALAVRHREEASRLAAELAREQGKARTELIRRTEARRRAIYDGDLNDDERIQDPRVVALMHMTEAVVGWRPTAPQFVFGFALFISLTMELGILLAFDTITLSALPALAVQHREEVTTEAMLAELRGTADREELRHRDTMDRVRKSADRVVERGEAAAKAPRLDDEPIGKAPEPRKAA
jgi:hypothetical protein